MCSPFCQPDIQSKFIIIRLIPVGKIPCLTGYSYPQRVIILVVCTLMFLVDSRIRKLQNRGISTKTLDEHQLLKEAYAFLFRSSEAFLQNEKWRDLLRNMFSKQLTSRGGTPRKIGWECAARFLKPLPYLWPKSAKFPTLFMTWPLKSKPCFRAAI